jgi:hypothetical protein
MTYREHVTTGDYVQVQLARERGHQAYVDLFTRTGAAVLLTPTLGCEAFSHGANHPSAIGGVEIAAPWSDWCGFLYDANLAGLPACAVRSGWATMGCQSPSSCWACAVTTARCSRRPRRCRGSSARGRSCRWRRRSVRPIAGGASRARAR